MKRAVLGLAVAFVIAAITAAVAFAGPPVTAENSYPVGKVVTPRPLGGPVIVESSPVPVVGAVIPRAPTVPDVMRQMWIDHCAWSRMVTMAMFSDLKGCDVYEERLMDNAHKFRSFFVSYYGESGTKLADLFEEHVVIGGRVLYALKSDDQAFRTILVDWYKNAEEIANLLHEVNPRNWPAEETELMWRTHLDMVLDQALTFSKQEWFDDVRAYDTMQLHSLRMADFMTKGIVKQFPPK